MSLIVRRFRSVSYIWPDDEMVVVRWRYTRWGKLEVILFVHVARFKSCPRNQKSIYNISLTALQILGLARVVCVLHPIFVTRFVTVRQVFNAIFFQIMGKKSIPSRACDCWISIQRGPANSGRGRRPDAMDSLSQQWNCFTSCKRSQHGI